MNEMGLLLKLNVFGIMVSRASKVENIKTISF